MNKKNWQDIIIISLISLISSLVISLYFLIFPPPNFETHVPHGSDEVLERNYDGPIYIVIAKTLYNIDSLKKIYFNNLLPIYYANHFPLLPLLIKLCSLFFHSYFRSLIIITWSSSMLYAVFFYLFISKFKLSKKPLLLAIISLFIPPRWLAVRTVGGTEPLFMLFIIIALYFWFNKQYIYSSIFSMLLVLIRPPGIIFFFSFLAMSIYQFRNNLLTFKYFTKVLSLILMPLTILGLFIFFQINFGNFWAFFQAAKTTTANKFSIMPFASVLGYNTPLVEGFLYLIIFYSIGIYLLWRQKENRLAIFSLIYLIPFFFINFDDDLYRYLIPISPFCIIIGYQKIWQQKIFKYFFLFFLISIYIYTFSILPKRMFHYNDYASLRLITN